MLILWEEEQTPEQVSLLKMKANRKGGCDEAKARDRFAYPSDRYFAKDKQLQTPEL